MDILTFWMIRKKKKSIQPQARYIEREVLKMEIKMRSNSKKKESSEFEVLLVSNYFIFHIYSYCENQRQLL